MCWVALLKRGWSHLLFVDDPIVICGWSNCYSRRIPLLFADDPICYSWMILFVICGLSHLLFLDDPICYSWMIPFVIHGWSHLLFADDPICYSWMIPFVIHGWSHLLFMDDPICYLRMIPSHQSVSSFGGSRLSSQLPPPLHTPPISVYTQQKIQCCMW